VRSLSRIEVDMRLAALAAIAAAAILPAGCTVALVSLVDRLIGSRAR
jgi:hypothetical protein